MSGVQPYITPALIVALFGGFVGLLKLVLKALSEQRQEFQTFLGNHMSGNTRAMQDTSQALHDLAAEVRATRKQALLTAVRKKKK